MDKVYQIKIPVFKAGRQIDSRGNENDWSIAELDEAIGAYNRLSKENDMYLAPLTVKHLPGVGSNQKFDPELAQGYANSYVREGDTVYVDGVRQFRRDFIEALQRGEHKKVSQSWHKPNSPHNPHPETFYPNHTAYVLHPSIPLKVPSYQAPESDTNPEYFSSYEFSLSDFSMSEPAAESTPSNSDRGNDGAKPDAIQVAEYQTSLDAEYRTKHEALVEKERKQQANFEQKQQEFEAQKQQQQAELDRKNAEIARKQAELKKAELSNFCQEHQSKFRAGEVPGAIDFMMNLDDSETADFSTDGGTEKKTPLQWFKDFAASRADVSPVGGQEIAPPATDPKIPVPASATTVNYTAPDGTSVDPATADFDRKIQDLILAEKREGRTLSYDDALDRLSREAK
ncbi:MAG: hypothetical protein J7647_21980 [Cyanobacteria bacterium SBLK]|nr:hypothetical protein [Cyanobacteria bacterium SBLK]